MRYLVRLPLFLLLFTAVWGCSSETTVDAARVDEAVPEPIAVPEDVQPAAPAPAPETPRPLSPAPRRAPDRAASEPAPVQPIPQPAPVPVPSASIPAPPVTDSARLDPEPARAPAPKPAPSVEMYTVPSGTPLTVVMGGLVSTETSKDGDTFEATLAETWSVAGKIVAERGDTVVGRVQDVMQPGKVKGKAQLTLVLTDIFPGSRGYRISTEPFVAIAVDNKERDAAIIAGGAGIGAAIGAITGGKKGAAIGAIIGGGGGTATVLATPGQDMKIEPETKVNFVLDDSIRLPVIREVR